MCARIYENTIRARDYHILRNNAFLVNDIGSSLMRFHQINANPIIHRKQAIDIIRIKENKLIDFSQTLLKCVPMYVKFFCRQRGIKL